MGIDSWLLTGEGIGDEKFVICNEKLIKYKVTIIISSIDFIVFYAASAIFQQFNGAFSVIKVDWSVGLKVDQRHQCNEKIWCYYSLKCAFVDPS